MNTSINRNNLGLSLVGLIAIVALIGVLVSAMFCVRVYTVEGNAIGVIEDWNGVRPDPAGPGTYFFMFNPSSGNKSIYTYATSGNVFVMNDKDDAQEPFAHGRRFDALTVNSLDNQQVKFHISVTWRIDPAHVVALHKNYRNNIEERLIRPEVTNAIGIRATLQNAIDLYSGPKLNTLREVVTAELRDPQGKLAQSGVVVDRVVIDKPILSSAYEAIIEQRQLNIATESQQKELEKANVATANAAKAAALKQQYEQVVAAETSKQTAILQQQATSEQAIIQAAANAKNTVVTQEAEAQRITIAAKAEKDRNVLIASGEKEAAMNRAQAIQSLGEAEANALKLKLGAYAAQGSDGYVRIQVAQSLATAFSNVKGYLPANVNYSTVGRDFDGAVNALVGNGQPATK